jgi:uncharacterized membrane protein
MTPGRRERFGLAALLLAFALVYSLIGLFRHWRFATNGFDLGIFDQAIWHASRLEAPASTVSGFGNVLGDHFSPILFTLAPLYWIAPRPETLIVAQAVLFALSLLPVARFVRRRLDATPTFLLCAACGLFWGLQRAAAFDVHELAFAPLLVAVALVAVDERRWGLLWTTAAGIVLVKEDLIPLLGFLGLYLFLSGERRRGLTLATAGIGAFMLVVGVLVPSLSDKGYQHAGSFRGVIERPWTIPAMLVTPPAKIYTVLMWLAPFMFLPLASPLAILLVAFALVRLLSMSPTHWSINFHYSAPITPLLAMSAADGLSRIASRFHDPISRRRVVTTMSAACLLLSLFLPGNQPLWDLFEAEHYQSTDVHRAGRRAVAIIPAGATVVAQGVAVPHLSQRPRIYMLTPTAPPSDVVIACTRLDPYPNGSIEDVRALIEERRRQGYRVIFEEAGWIVLQR